MKDGLRVATAWAGLKGELALKAGDGGFFFGLVVGELPRRVVTTVAGIGPPMSASFATTLVLRFGAVKANRGFEAGRGDLCDSVAAVTEPATNVVM